MEDDDDLDGIKSCFKIDQNRVDNSLACLESCYEAQNLRFKFFYGRKILVELGSHRLNFNSPREATSNFVFAQH